MASLHDVLVHLTREYPHKQELSNARLTKMVYLADWRAAITNHRQITNLSWKFNHYGPFLHDVLDAAKGSDDFAIEETQTMFGSPKKAVVLANPSATAELEDWERNALGHVIRETSNLYWSDFIELVYSTYPIVSQDRYADLDLVALAADYEELQKRLPQG